MAELHPARGFPAMRRGIRDSGFGISECGDRHSPSRSIRHSPFAIRNSPIAAAPLEAALDPHRGPGAPRPEHRARDRQHGAPAPGDARRAPGDGDAGRRDRGGRAARRGLPPPRHREDLRDHDPPPGHPLHGPHGLPRPHVEQHRAGHGGGEAHRLPDHREVPRHAGHLLRDGAPLQPPALDRHGRPRHRRRHGLLLRVHGPREASWTSSSA